MLATCLCLCPRPCDPPLPPPRPVPPAAAAEVKNCATRLGYVWQSTGCDSFYWQRVRPLGHRHGGGHTP